MRVLRKSVTLFLSIILFALILVMMSILSAKTLISRDNLSDYSKNVDILNVDLGIIFNLDEKGVTLREEIYKQGLDSGIPDIIMEDILRSDEINIVLGDFFKNTIDYVLKNTVKPSISSSTVDKMIKLANESLENHMNIMMSSNELEIYVRNYCNRLTDIVPDRDLILKDYNINSIDRINQIIYFDMTNIYILILVVCLLICIVNRSIYKLFRYLGFTMILNGIIFVILGCLNDFFSTLLIDRYSNLGNFLEPLTINILTIIFKNGVLVSFSGLFIYLIYIIVNRIKLNSKINELLSKQ